MEGKDSAEYNVKDIEKVEGVSADISDTTNGSDHLKKKVLGSKEGTWIWKILNYGVEARGIQV